MKIIIGRAGGLSSEETHPLLGVLGMSFSEQLATNRVEFAMNNIYTLGRAIVIRESARNAFLEWCLESTLIHRMVELVSGLPPESSLFFRGGDFSEKASSDFLSTSLDALGGDSWTDLFTVPMRIEGVPGQPPQVSLSMAWIDRMVRDHMMVPVRGQLDDGRGAPHPGVVWRQIHRILSTGAPCRVAIAPRFDELEAE